MYLDLMSGQWLEGAVGWRLLDGVFACTPILVPIPVVFLLQPSSHEPEILAFVEMPELASMVRSGRLISTKEPLPEGLTLK